MKALLIGISSTGKAQVLYAGEKYEARIRYRDYKPRVGVVEVQLWDRAKGKIKTKAVQPVTRKKKDAK